MPGLSYKYFVVALLATQLVSIIAIDRIYDDGPIDSVDNVPNRNIGGKCRLRLSKCETKIANLQHQAQELQVELEQVNNEKTQEINTRARVEAAIRLMTFQLQHPGDPVSINNFRPLVINPEAPTIYEAAFDSAVAAQCIGQLPRCHRNLRSMQEHLQMQKQHVAEGRTELEDLRRMTEAERDKARILARRLNEMLQSRYEAKYGPLDSN